MPLGFADSIDGDYAFIWMRVESVEDARNNHHSIRMMPVVEYDPDATKAMPNPAYHRWGLKDRAADKRATWYKIIRNIGTV